MLPDLTIETSRPIYLLGEVVEILKPIPCVNQIILFGSLARHNWDEWSDIDLLIVIQNRADILPVYNAIRQQKQILHHHRLTRAEPNGVHCLGMVFEDESVFTCIDFNFLSIADVRQPDALTRFGHINILYNQTTKIIDHDETAYPQQALTESEAEISTGIHFLKKAIKQSLRGNYDKLTITTRKQCLETIIAKYPDNRRRVGNNIGALASRYLNIATALLETEI